MISREWISDVKIERRGKNGGMNITLFVEPPERKLRRARSTYDELVRMANGVFRGAMNVDDNSFVPTHADVMAWSHGDTVTECPDRYRVSLDLCPPDKAEDGRERD